MFIIGPPGSGKTAVWKCLAQQETNAGNETAAQIINPKSVDSDELFGFMTASEEWMWGVFSTVMDRMS
jgi:dynein heavy chain